MPNPLQLTDFESYLVADDRIDYPMTFVMQLELTGSLQPDAWSRALLRTLPRHPLLTARMTRGLRGRQWVFPASSSPLEVPHEWNVLPDWDQLARIDLRREAGVRFWTRHGESEVTVIGEFHHACCDGVGALQFFGDWLAAYEGELHGDGKEIAWTQLRPEMLRDRGRPRWRASMQDDSDNQGQNSRRKSLWNLQEIRDFAREVWLWGTRKPCPLAAASGRISEEESGRDSEYDPASEPRNETGSEHRSDSEWKSERKSQQTSEQVTAPAPKRSLSSRSAFSEIVHETLSREETVQLRQTARQHQATVNDQLLSTLFETLNAWNRRNRSGDSPWLVITMPTNLRQAADNYLPATNVIGYGFITRPSEAMKDPQALLSGIAAETKAIRSQGLANYFLTGLRWARRIPGGLSFATRRSVCHATAVFSNLGDPQRRMNPRLPRQQGRIVIGDLVLQRVLAVPPLRPQTRAVFLASQSGNELTLCLSYDRHTLDSAAGRWLLSDWTERIRHVIRAEQPANRSLIGDGRQQVEPANEATREPGGEQRNEGTAEAIGQDEESGNRERDASAQERFHAQVNHPRGRHAGDQSEEAAQ